MCSYARSRSIKGVNKLGFLLQLAFYDLKATGGKKRRRQYAHSSVELRGAILNDAFQSKKGDKVGFLCIARKANIR